MAAKVGREKVIQLNNPALKIIVNSAVSQIRQASEVCVKEEDDEGSREIYRLLLKLLREVEAKKPICKPQHNVV